MPEPYDAGREAMRKLRPVFDEMWKRDRRVDFANGCRCDDCITVNVEDETGVERPDG